MLTGYVSLGDISFDGYYGVKNVRCVNQNYTKPCDFGNKLWEDHITNDHVDVSLF